MTKRGLAFLCAGAVALGATAVHAAVDAAADAPPPAAVDTAPCFAAIVAADDDRVLAVCGDLIGHEKTAATDRVKALAARAAVLARRAQLDPAIADYDAALKLDPLRPDLLNARGEAWRSKGDRPRAIRDFGAAIKLDPQNEAVRANYKMLAQEIERLGAQMSVPPAAKAPLK